MVQAPQAEDQSELWCVHAPLLVLSNTRPLKLRAAAGKHANSQRQHTRTPLELIIAFHKVLFTLTQLLALSQRTKRVAQLTGPDVMLEKRRPLWIPMRDSFDMVIPRR